MGDDGIRYLDTWKMATSPDERPVLRTLATDGTLHFSHMKKLALSGTQYLHSVNSELEPNRDMRIGTIVHLLLLGARDGAKPIVVYKGGIRRGKEWDAFEAAHRGDEIVSVQEWDEAEQIAESVRLSPVARRRLEGARLEVPLRWEENGIPCSTSGIDIVPVCDDVGDLKTTATTQPELFMKQSFRMFYPQQLAFYRRGARAHGIKAENLFILGVERKAPFEVVELNLTEAMVTFADRTIDLWIERLRVLRTSIPDPRHVTDWPGYAQAPIPWDVPAWAIGDEELDEDEEEAA